MEFYAFHGHYNEELKAGNWFPVDLTIETGMVLASESDNSKDAVNYHAGYELVKNQKEKKSYFLENIARRILSPIHAEPEGVRRVIVKVSKINPPMGGKISRFSVVPEC